MTENDFMKQIAQYNMPDISCVKNECIGKLHTKPSSKYSRISRVAVAATAVAMLCLCAFPVSSLASSLMQHIQAVLKLNDSDVELGDVEKSDIHIPDDCEKAEIDGTTYLNKAYNSLSDLTDDIQTNFYVWTGADKFLDNGILLNIIPDDYGRVSLLYDLTNGSDDLQSVCMYVYFPLASDISLDDLMLENEQLKYATIDDSGNIEKYEQNTNYELIEQYTSPNLNTTVSVIASRSDTDGSGDYGAISETDNVYYMYFTLDGMCYQINCVGTLDKAHDVIENIQKTSRTASQDVPLEDGTENDNSGSEWIQL